MSTWRNTVKSRRGQRKSSPTAYLLGRATKLAAAGVNYQWPPEDPQVAPRETASKREGLVSSVSEFAYGQYDTQHIQKIYFDNFKDAEIDCAPIVAYIQHHGLRGRDLTEFLNDYAVDPYTRFGVQHYPGISPQESVPLDERQRESIPLENDKKWDTIAGNIFIDLLIKLPIEEMESSKSRLVQFVDIITREITKDAPSYVDIASSTWNDMQGFASVYSLATATERKRTGEALRPLTLGGFFADLNYTAHHHPTEFANVVESTNDLKTMLKNDFDGNLSTLLSSLGKALGGIDQGEALHSVTSGGKIKQHQPAKGASRDNGPELFG